MLHKTHSQTSNSKLMIAHTILSKLRGILTNLELENREGIFRNAVELVGLGRKIKVDGGGEGKRQNT